MIAATSAEYSQQSHDYQSWLQSIWVIQANVYFTVNDLYGDQYLLNIGENKATFLAAVNDFEPLLAKDLSTWKDLIEAHPDQFVWGTDRGDAVWTFDREVGQRLVAYARAFIGRLDPDVQERFAYKNAERLVFEAEAR